MRLRSLVFLFPLLGACAVESSDSGTTEDRGSLGKADLVGSCAHPVKDLCGGKGTGNCWCDDACVDFGDCCSNAAEVCGIDVPPPDGQLCGGWLGDTCADDEYCAYEPGQWCGAADASATCETRPEACILLFDPVCGCDGNTYSNSCFAASAGTGVLHEGECESVPPPGQFCGGFAGFPCPEGQVCVDDPNDDCDPQNGGADCGGVCVDATDPPKCSDVLCALFCENGFQTDDDGCPICACNPDPEPTDCVVSGCSGEICAEEPMFSICIFQPWYECFALSSCGNFGADGGCGWQETPEFSACMAEHGQGA